MSGLNIKNPDAEAKIRELAALTGEKITEAVMRAVDERLASVKRETASKTEILDKHRRLEIIAQRSGARQILDKRTPECILGYGDDGLPQ